MELRKQEPFRQFLEVDIMHLRQLPRVGAEDNNLARVQLLTLAGVLILMLPELFGTHNKMAPLAKSKARAPSLKLKMVFAPRRVMVALVKVSSPRDSLPVLMRSTIDRILKCADMSALLD